MKMLGVILWAITTSILVYSWIKKDDELRGLAGILYLVLMLFQVFMM